MTTQSQNASDETVRERVRRAADQAREAALALYRKYPRVSLQTKEHADVLVSLIASIDAALAS